MIVSNLGYKKIDFLKELIENGKAFSIHNTHKNTQILFLIRSCGGDISGESIYYPQKDRLPWKTTEGKRITTVKEKVFDSTKNSLEELNTEKWNNGNQILCYQEYSSF